MITDWNSPQGDFDPTEKQGELLMLLSGQQVTVHTSAEDDFDYMENEDVAFVVKNPHSEEDLLIETAQTEGYVSESNQEIAVVLDTNLTPELIEEGFVREVISKIQTMRKDAGFEVVDHIRVYEQGNDKIKEIIKTNESQIKADVLADEVILDKTEGYTADWKINGEAVTLGVAKVEA